jgi:hypothetical protein
MSGRWNPQGKWSWKGIVAFCSMVLTLSYMAMWAGGLVGAWAGRRSTSVYVPGWVRAGVDLVLLLGLLWAVPVLGKLCRVRRERVSLPERESTER